MSEIKIRIKEEEDLYNSINPDGIQLSEDIKAYIFSRLRQYKGKDSFEIQILSPASIDDERLKTAFHFWADEELREINLELRRNRQEQYYLFGLGLLFIIISMILQDRVTPVFFTILSTIGAFSIWEAANVWILKNPRLKIKKQLIQRFRDDTPLILKTDNFNEVET